MFERYGFEPVETPAIEYTDALGKFLPDQDRPNEGVFSFQDDDEQWLSLRYDLTAPLARYVAENFQNLALPYRSYRYGYAVPEQHYTGAQGGCRIYSGPFSLIAGVSGEKGGIPIKLW